MICDSLERHLISTEKDRNYFHVILKLLIVG